MKYIRRADVTLKDTLDSVYAPKINMLELDVLQLVEQIGRLGKDEEAQDLLNTFGQNIEGLDTVSNIYWHNGVRLSLAHLSSGERLFLVAFAAALTGRVLYLQYDIRRLSRESKLKFFKRFNDCDNIKLMYSYMEETYTYNRYERLARE